MAKFQAYAVLKGRKPGVYRTWAECEIQTKGFSGPVFKGFMSVEEAENWLANGGKVLGGATAKKAVKEDPVIDLENFNPKAYFEEDHLDTNALPPVMPEVYAFVDGSFNEHHADGPVYGYGGILHVVGEDVPICGSGSEPEFVVSRQIPGEVFGAIAAIEKAIELNVKHLVIFYDYNGIGHWATAGKRWKAESAIARKYVECYDALSEKIKVNFYHVKGHDEIAGNEIADQMAKKSVGLL